MSIADAGLAPVHRGDVPMARIPAIDGLRAAAILAVLACHWLGNIFPGGFFGVDLFFVISGFVITRSLTAEWDRSGTINLPGFAWRRVRRLWPALAAMLLLVFGLAIAADSAEYRQSVLIAALSVSNWVRALSDWDGGLIGHTWSLSAEEQFYLIWPLVLLLTAALRNRIVLARALVVAIVAAALWRIVLLQSGAHWQRLYFGLDTHSDGLLIGCLLAVWRPHRLAPQLLAAWWIPAAVLLAMGLTLHTEDWFTLAIGLLLAPACAGWLVLAALEPANGLEVLASRPAVWLGTRSYSLYLWHLPLFVLVEATNQPIWLTLPAAVALSLGVAEVSFRLLERPFAASLRRAAPAPRTAAPSVAIGSD